MAWNSYRFQYDELGIFVCIFTGLLPQNIQLGALTVEKYFKIRRVACIVPHHLILGDGFDHKMWISADWRQ